MIRINLLAVERERTKRRALIPPAHRVTIVASLILVGTALLIGWWFWSLRRESARVDDEIAKAEVEMQQLRSVLMQVRQFETSKAALQQRVTLIEQLRRGQSGPVHVVDEISKTLPEYTWLTEVVQRGDEFTITGMTTSLTGVSDYIANLSTSAWFQPPVELIDSQIDATQRASEPLIRFSIKARFRNPEAPAAPAAGRGAAPAGRGAAPPVPPAAGRAGG
jgi:type IV pilus assembly protein PilN